MDSKHDTFYTIDKEGNIIGKITDSEIRPIITEYEHIREVLVARDIASKNITTVIENDDLDYVMKLFENKNSDEFPVINPDNGKIIGIVRREDVIAAYNRESFKYNVVEGFARELKSISTNKLTRVMDGYSIVEKKPPKNFIGKRISDIKLRNNFGLEILMIKRNNSPYNEDESDSGNFILPNPQYIIGKDDVLILFGADEKIALTENWEADR
ncbi:MAG: CBS domain-containing protein, partial [Ignavibacteria bacterium]|nr:CBS domain-containing protein [Ignavibacteria bacterium]